MNNNNRIGIPMRALVFFLLILPVQLFGQSAPVIRKTDKSTVLYLFQHQLFKSLSSRLEAYQSAYDVNYTLEDNMYDAVDAFSKTDTAFEPLFVRWIKECPESFAPFAARAKYYFMCGRKARGSKWIVQKDQREYREMEHYFSLALSDIQEALKKNPRLDICYATLVEIASASANDEMKINALADALKNHPYAYRIRYTYLMTLVPRLGGSYEIMKAFSDRCAKDTVFNPRLAELSSVILADKGRVFSYLGKYEEAVTMFTEALNSSIGHSTYADRGDAYLHLRDYSKALSDYQHALDLSPNNPDYLNRKSDASASKDMAIREIRTNQRTRQSDASRERTTDLSLISERKQINKHMEQGNSSLQNGHFQEAVEEFSEVIRLVPYEFMPYYNRATCYVLLRNEDAALQDLLRVIEIKPDYRNAHARVTSIYAQRGQYDDALISLNKILSMEPNNGEALYERARIFERKGSIFEAHQDMQQACDLGYQRACRYYKQVR